MIFNKAVYDKLKFIALILLPAFSTLYFTLGAIWSLPAVQEVIGTIASIDAFLGTLLGLTTMSYRRSDARFDGNLEVSTNDMTGIKTFSLALNKDPEHLENSQEVLFKVTPE